MVKRVAVIGAGCAGLVTLKNCLDYGFDAVCLEKCEDIGGLWRYKPQECKESSVMRNTVTNTSKEMMAFSDFPPPIHFPNYLPHRKYLEYLHLYTENFKLRSHIRFNTILQSIDRCDDHEKTGRWKVVFKDIRQNQTVTEIFDAVFLCTGHYADTYIPNVDGLHEFKGRILHSRDYKDIHGLEDERIVVVGMGNSGCDIAVELTQVASKVILSTNHGNWVASRLADEGCPTDLAYITRFEKFKATYFRNFASDQKENRLNRYFDHEKYGIKPDYPVFRQISVVNEYLPHRIISGEIAIKPRIRQIFPDGRIIFNDGSMEEKIDAVIFSTGFSFSFPYLEGGNLIPVRDNMARLYRHMYSPDLAHPQTLAVIGLVQPGGSHGVTAEMQARFACELLSENCRLPPSPEMQRDIDAKLSMKRALWGQVGRHAICENYMVYVDQLAEMIHAKPNLIGYLLTDPRLAMRLFFGPYLPYQFRLCGPKQWSGARSAIMTVWDRVWYPTEKKKVEMENLIGRKGLICIFFGFMAVGALAMMRHN